MKLDLNMQYLYDFSCLNSVTIICGVTIGMAASLILLIFVAALIICCFHTKWKRQKQKREVDWTRDIFVTDEIPHITSGSSLKKAKNGSMLLQPVDPFEFPRSKLVFLNTLLGKYFLVCVLCSVCIELATTTTGMMVM